MRSRYEKLIEQVNEGEGFELLRLACRKFDPKAPHLKQHSKAQFYRLPDDKCKNFAAVLERIDLIERLCKAMTEATGERPDDEFLAEILVPGMTRTRCWNWIYQQLSHMIISKSKALEDPSIRRTMKRCEN